MRKTALIMYLYGMKGFCTKTLHGNLCFSFGFNPISKTEKPTTVLQQLNSSISILLPCSPSMKCHLFISNKRLVNV